METARARRIAALSLLTLSAVVATYLAPGWELWSAPFTRFCSALLALLVLGTAAAVWTDSTAARRVLASGGLLAYLAIYLYWLFETPIPRLYPGSESPVYIGMFFFISLGGAVGIALRRRWGRWLALALGATGAASSGMNLVGAYWNSWPRIALVWAMGMGLVFSLALLALLWSRKLAGSDRQSVAEGVWKSPDPLVGWTRAATIGGVGSALMLIVFAWNQHGTAEVYQWPATALAGVLLTASGLASRGKALGVVLLAAGALALLALSVIIAIDPPAGHLNIAVYYHVFWLPTALCALVCGARALARVRRD